MFFVLKSPEVLANCIASLKEFMGYSVEIKPYKKIRSTRQNKLYWSLLGIIAKDKGYDTEDLHLALKIRFLGTQEKTIAGQVYTVPNSTTKLTTTQFCEYVDRVYALGAELGVKLPQPSFWGLDD